MRNWCASISISWPSRRLRRKRRNPLRPKSLRRTLLPLPHIRLLNRRRDRLLLHLRQELRALRLRLLRLGRPRPLLLHIRLLNRRRRDRLLLHLRLRPPLGRKDRQLQFIRHIRPRRRSNARQRPAPLSRNRDNLVPECHRAPECHSGRQARRQPAKDHRCVPDNRCSRVPVRHKECARRQPPDSRVPAGRLVPECHSAQEGRRVLVLRSAQVGLHNGIHSVLEWDVRAKVPADSVPEGHAPADSVLADRVA
jgi:hypothetical protein